MALGRSKRYVMSNAISSSGIVKGVMPHNEFIHRIRKSLYFGNESRVEKVNISRPLADYASDFFSEPYKGHSLNRLYFGDLPSFCLHATPCSLIMALIYLDRLSVIDPCYARRITPQELFVVSMMISTKFYAGHDEEFYLSDWAEDGEMTEKRLKQLELEFLCAIDWNIYISNEQFFTKLASIEKTVARREGMKRGWLTYTELMQLLPSFTLAKLIIQSIAVMIVSYAASIMTIAGAFFLVSQIPGNALHKETIAVLRKTIVHDVVTSTTETVPLTSEVLPTITDKNLSKNGTMVIHHETAVNLNRSAFNVEDELIKWEQQYREEAERDKLRLRQHEINSNTRLSLLTNPIISKTANTLMMSRPKNLYTEHTWLLLKAEYSEESPTQINSVTVNDAIASSYDITEHGNSEHGDLLENCIGNCSKFIYWQSLANAGYVSLVRLPILWFKFM